MWDSELNQPLNLSFALTVSRAETWDKEHRTSSAHRFQSQHHITHCHNHSYLQTHDWKHAIAAWQIQRCACSKDPSKVNISAPETTSGIDCKRTSGNHTLQLEHKENHS